MKLCSDLEFKYKLNSNSYLSLAHIVSSAFL